MKKLSQLHVLEQFLYGLPDSKVKRYICKRNPADMYNALKLARDCEEIEKWMTEAEFSRKWTAERVGALQVELGQIKRENRCLKMQVAPSKPNTKRRRSKSAQRSPLITPTQ